jgi:[NiFe] hydrogenase diaphorase moiety large subunit
MAGNLEVLERLCSSLWVERGKPSEDGLVLVDTTSCTGMGDQGPAILVNGRAIPGITPERADAVAELIRARVPVEDWPAELFVIADNIHRKDILLGSETTPGAAIRAAIDQTVKSARSGRRRVCYRAQVGILPEGTG